MALSEPEAKVLGALFYSNGMQVLTVQRIRLTTRLSEGSVRRALLRLARTGLALSTQQRPANWRPTERGRLVINKPPYIEYVRMP
ncbi:hypothetical protein [Nocardia seriolae]|uniref:MarR family transcriptional regulator n=1 Tax=Nocardia seriolae TaxID=37332 RepID=A0ABC8ASP9_9NOCA|nr:hypothetical protein [Nocardia seriolae]APA97335.1 hypothetical protein NS506_03282 [Nocardia seriolae]MTJ62248.1 hypothetical protein [Nocardia seriolae]MTJ75786.1 hypothetical protein [Nocardia seriolae]MTJ87155.1 hypothetical protein [Nocardia seriolae]MTK31149.1 hypothetical protein [Nocardia seriolae]